MHPRTFYCSKEKNERFLLKINRRYNLIESKYAKEYINVQRKNDKLVLATDFYHLLYIDSKEKKQEYIRLFKKDILV